MLKRNGQIRALSLLGIPLILLGPSIHAFPDHARRARVRMTMSGTATMPDGALVALGGFLSEPEFFDRLEQKKTSDGILFQRDGKPVEFFPSEMQFRLSVTGLPQFDEETQRRVEPNLNAQSLSALRFFAFWKKGLEMRPVELLSLLTMSVERRPSILFPSWPGVPETYQVWVFEFRVRTRAVPVTDHFILTIETPTKERLARLSARLGN